ncbi:MAG TPA: hypothetical protein VFQ35_26130 [Polyangiaceae bacterium]|nr:hypothetical protein [Polyangiaceae bacterium]
MDELSKAASELVSEMRRGGAASEGARERVRQRLTVSLSGASAAAVGAASASATVKASTAAAQAATVVSVSKLAFLVALGALGGSAVLTPVALLSAPPATSIQRVSPAPTPHAQSRGVSFDPAQDEVRRGALASQPSPVDAPLATARAVHEPTPLSPIPPRATLRPSVPEFENNLSAETELLARVRERLRAGSGAESLALLAEHARRFPNGVLAEEAAASRVLALCSLGRTADGDSEKARFYRTYPHSVLGPRLERACAR